MVKFLEMLAFESSIYSLSIYSLGAQLKSVESAEDLGGDNELRFILE